VKKFVSYEKLSKKARREISVKRRVLWRLDPKTKVVPDNYKQRKEALKNKDIED